MNQQMTRNQKVIRMAINVIRITKKAGIQVNGATIHRKIRLQKNRARKMAHRWTTPKMTTGTTAGPSVTRIKETMKIQSTAKAKVEKKIQITKLQKTADRMMASPKKTKGMTTPRRIRRFGISVS